MTLIQGICVEKDGGRQFGKGGPKLEVWLCRALFSDFYSHAQLSYTKKTEQG